MRRVLLLGICAFFVCGCSMRAADVRPLGPFTSIPLPGVHGRIDHLSMDARGHRLFVSALGSDMLEVIDLHSGKVIKSITGIEEPQGVLYVAGVNKIFVDSGGDGTCKVYDGSSYQLRDTIRFPSDADDIRFDPARNRVYVGYGDRGAAGIGAIDAATDQVVARIPLPSHPEALSLQASPARIFVNIPSAGNIIAVVNRSTRAVVSQWTVEGARANFPMAIDRAGHRLFVVTRAPARLIVYDTDSGKQLASLPSVGVADDVYFDSAHKLVLISGGEGFVDAFQQEDLNHYRLLQRLKTSPGARTSLLVPESERFYLAVPRRGSRPAEVRVYQIH
jgi:DNA-binding beta-propeller fold protein YncE